MSSFLVREFLSEFEFLVSMLDLGLGWTVLFSDRFVEGRAAGTLGIIIMGLSVLGISVHNAVGRMTKMRSRAALCDNFSIAPLWSR